MTPDDQVTGTFSERPSGQVDFTEYAYRPITLSGSALRGRHYPHICVQEPDGVDGQVGPSSGTQPTDVGADNQPVGTAFLPFRRIDQRAGRKYRDQPI